MATKESENWPQMSTELALINWRKNDH